MTTEKMHDIEQALADCERSDFPGDTCVYWFAEYGQMPCDTCRKRIARQAAIGAAVERLFVPDREMRLEWMPADSEGEGFWFARRSNGMAAPNVSRPWTTGDGDTLPAAIAAALGDEG